MQTYGDEDEHNNPLQRQGQPVCFIVDMEKRKIRQATLSH